MQGRVEAGEPVDRYNVWENIKTDTNTTGKYNPKFWWPPSSMKYMGKSRGPQRRDHHSSKCYVPVSASVRQPVKVF